MTKIVIAVKYEDGTLRPIEIDGLSEGSRVRLTIQLPDAVPSAAAVQTEVQASLPEVATAAALVAEPVESSPVDNNAAGSASVGGIGLGLAAFLKRGSAGQGSETGSNWRPFLTWPTVALLFVTAILLFLAIKVSMQPDLQPEQNRWGFYLWLVCLATFVAAFMLHWRPAPNLRGRLYAARWEIALVAAMTLAALLIRVVRISEIPFPFQGDEGDIGLTALSILEGRVGNMFSTGWSDQPILCFLPIAFFIQMLGRDIAAVRMLSVILSTATIPLLYTLGRRMYAPVVGAFAAAYLLTWHYHIHFSRVGWHDVLDGFFAVLSFWLVYRAIHSGMVTDYMWAGFATGFSIYAYVGARLVFLLAFFFVGAWLVARWRQIADVLPGAAVFTAGAFVVAGPQLVYFMNNPNLFMSRMNTVGASGSWLGEAARRANTSPAVVVGGRMWQTLRGFIVDPAIGGFLEATAPLLGALAAILFIVGMIYVIAHVLEFRSFMLLSWFWVSMLLGGGLTSDEAWHRLLILAPAVCLFIALALTLLLSLLLQAKRIPRWASWAAVTAVLIVSMLSSANYYFREYIPGNTFVTYGAELFHNMGFYLRGLGPQYNAYFGGAPRVFVNFASLPYLAGDVTAVDMPTVSSLRDVPPLPNNKHAVFIVTAPRRAELELIRQKYPGGTWREFPSVHPNEMLFYAYEVRNPTVAN
ncbi:MAG: glycosyltransferase family 39 protein [Anaerolineae bacterium]